jgi:uncharacterized OB-fold protein
LVAAALGVAHYALAADAPTPVAERRPGYGVVESVTPIRVAPAEESASAGSSSRGSAPGYLVRVKLDDGSIQIRQLKKRNVAVGKRVLVTNAGDVLPE